MDSDNKVKYIIQNLELNLLKPRTRASESEMEKYLADDFVEFGSYGRIWDKKSIIAALVQEQDEANSVLEADNLSTTRLSHDIVLITYRCVRKNSEGEVLRTTLRSSIWRQNGGNWQMHFHQGTLIED